MCVKIAQFQQRQHFFQKVISLVDDKLEVLDPTPDIYKLFNDFNKKFFKNVLAPVEVKWSYRMTSSAGVCSFSKNNKQCIISLSAPLLKLRPRKDLVETLLHEMIHAYLFLTNNDQDRDGHGLNFRTIMRRINKIAGTNISIYHDFHEEVKLYKQHWWKCDGPCQSKPPFFGMVRRSMNRPPGPSDYWWSKHQSSCGGKFIKVKEPENFKSHSKKNSKNSDPKSKKITDWFSTSSSSNGASRLASSEVLTEKDFTSRLVLPSSSRDNDMNFPMSNKNYTSHTSKKIGNSSNNVHGWGTGGPSNNPEKNNTIIPRTNPTFSCSGVVGGHSKQSILLDQFSSIGDSISQSTDRESLSDTPSTSRQTSADTSLSNSNQSGNNSSLCPRCNAPITTKNLFTHIDSCWMNDNNDNIELIDELNNNINNNNNELILPMPAAPSSSQSEDVSHNKRRKLEDEISIRYVNCPVCNNIFPADDINEHLDECLLHAETVHKEPIPSTSSASNNSVISINSSCGSDMDDSVIISPVEQSCDTNETDEKQRCLVCNAQIPLETSLNEHLEECIGDFSIGNVFTDTKISEKDNSTDRKYPCPVCMTFITENLMNKHLDKCLFICALNT